MTRFLRTPAALCLASALALAGCNSEAPSEKQTGTPAGGTKAASAKGDPEVQAEVDEIMAGLDQEERAKIEEELAKLSPNDRELAEEQLICYVSKAPIGSMAGATRVKVGDQDVLVCCEGCSHDLVEHPEKYEKFLAHLKAIHPAGGKAAGDAEPVAAPKPDDKG